MHPVFVRENMKVLRQEEDRLDEREDWWGEIKLVEGVHWLIRFARVWWKQECSHLLQIGRKRFHRDRLQSKKLHKRCNEKWNEKRGFWHNHRLYRMAMPIVFAREKNGYTVESLYNCHVKLQIFRRLNNKICYSDELFNGNTGHSSFITI